MEGSRRSTPRTAVIGDSRPELSCEEIAQPLPQSLYSQCSSILFDIWQSRQDTPNVRWVPLANAADCQSSLVADEASHGVPSRSDGSNDFAIESHCMKNPRDMVCVNLSFLSCAHSEDDRTYSRRDYPELSIPRGGQSVMHLVEGTQDLVPAFLAHACRISLEENERFGFAYRAIRAKVLPVTSHSETLE